MNKGLIAAVRRHAKRHYNQSGWDYLVECWSDEDIDHWIDGATDEMTAIMRCADVVATLDETREEVMMAGSW